MPPPDLKADIKSLMSSLDENKIYRIKKGRMIKDEEIVKDVVAVGFQNLTSGEKNPLSDYNASFKQLQMRRKMKPVTLTLLQGHSKSANPQTPPVLDVPPQTPLETPLIPTTEADEEAEVVDPEQVSEVEKILTDLADGVVDETFPRLTEEDVAFDMNEVVVEEEEIVEEEEDKDEEENDIGWIDEEEEESGM